MRLLIVDDDPKLRSYVCEGLEQSGIEAVPAADGEEALRLLREDGPEFDLIFTVCDSAAAETCPVWPGRPTSAHWGIPDPAAVQGSDAEKAAAFLDAFRMLKRRIDLMLALPITDLEQIALREKLQAIGPMADQQ